MSNITVGRLGEKMALSFLQDLGYELVVKNFRSRSGEIDLIVQKGNKLCFVEVKTRVGIAKGLPHEAIDARKIYHLKNTSQYYLLQSPHKNCKLSIDVVSIVLNADLTINKLKYFQNIL